MLDVGAYVERAAQCEEHTTHIYTTIKKQGRHLVRRAAHLVIFLSAARLLTDPTSPRGSSGQSPPPPPLLGHIASPGIEQQAFDLQPFHQENACLTSSKHFFFVVRCSGCHACRSLFCFCFCFAWVLILRAARVVRPASLSTSPRCAKTACVCLYSPGSALRSCPELSPRRPSLSASRRL